MKNLSLELARKYIDNFYKVVFSSNLSKEKKDSFNKAKKNVKKYEDPSYLKEVLDEEVLALFKSIFEKNKVDDIEKVKSLINDIDNYYNLYMEGKEIIDIKEAKKGLEALNKKLIAINNYYHFVDITPLYEFKNNVDVELNLYVDKHKSDEYMDMSIFHQSIKDLMKGVKDTLNEIINECSLDIDECINKYLESINHNYSIIFDSKDSKTGSIPSWAKGVLFCTPWILGFLVFTLYPLIRTFIFSFSQVNLTTQGFQTDLVGIKNYQNLLIDDTFIRNISNYLVQMVVYVPLITIFSLILAMLLNTKIKSKGLFRTIFFFPVIITSGPVIQKMIDIGVTAMPGLNSLMDIESIKAMMPSLVRTAFDILTNEFILILWYSGIQILVFLTALQKIDKGVYEAGAIDGANKWEQFWKITLPAINPTIVINVVFTVVMQSIFALSPIIKEIQDVIYDQNKGRGYSSAMAYVYFLLIIIVLGIFVLIFKRHEKKNKEAR